ncbi:MAG: aminoacyl-tRNA hydrolase [Pseudomonas fluorescens]|nr:MAG: aminoacyl-tRNA hydrolase [Pseudomonas fluorescens]
MNPAALEWKFFTAGGPGGQHVNKVATAAQLRVNVAALNLPEHATQKLLASATKEGDIIIVAKRYKSQEQNKADALQRLESLIEKARHIPRKRRATKPTRASGERRLSAKKTRATIKAGRGKISSE